MSDLSAWAGDTLRTVEQDGATPEFVRLVTTGDGQVWNTWSGPWVDVEGWVIKAQSYIRSLEQQWPTRAVGVLFVALTAQGEVLSQLPMTITGKARSGHVDSHSSAVTMAVDNVVTTHEKLQRLVMVQLDAARKQIEANARVMEEQTTLIQLYRQREVLGGSEPSEIEKMMVEQAPQVMSMLGHLLEKVATKK
ncbi:MAG: hypothetical protein K0U84_15135 [Actinomycetia bacterium]|nr:hypothetical protein [Actinomycetes bacterium]